MIEPKQLKGNQSSGGITVPSDGIIIVYVCQNPNCGNYFGSSNAGDIENKANYAPSAAKDAGQFRFYRSKCPECGTEREKRYARLVPRDEVNEIVNRLSKVINAKAVSTEV